MFWLFDNNYNKIDFLQIFNNYNKYKDSRAGCINLLYDFTSNSNSNSKIDDIFNEYNLIEVKPITVTYTIKVKDSYIQYSNEKSVLTFHIEKEFVKETDELNKFKVPYFKWKYSKEDNNKLPYISTHNYDFYYKKVNFDVYKINNNKLYIIETINNITKKYILDRST